MAFSTQAIRYGWYALASLGVLTGATIYHLANTRHQVQPQDIIELALGTDERAMATQTGTNGDGSPIYAVARPSFVRTLDYNYYEYGGYLISYTSYWPDATAHVVCYTNYRTDAYVKPPQINYAESWTATGGYVWVTMYPTYKYPLTNNVGETVTNIIGWHLDRDMLISLDSTIKALVPYYVDTNTVYDGTTNIIMLTVTGLWASLQIGDHTNQFTRTPSWTNPVSTNWVVSYINLETQGHLNQINAFAIITTNSGVVTTNFYYQFGYFDDYGNPLGYTNKYICYTGRQDEAVWVVTNIGSVYVLWKDYPIYYGTQTRWRQRFVPTQGYFISNGWSKIVQTVTNAATYGDYPWQIYVEDLQERYKVLNALKVTSAVRSRSYNGSDANQYWNRMELDPSGYIYSNSATHAVTGPAYWPYQGAYLLGLENAFYVSSYYSNNIPVNYWGECAPYTWYVHNMSYGEYQTWHSWWYFHQYAYEGPEQPPWTPYPDGYLEPTNVTDLGAGSYLAVTKEPWDGEYPDKLTWLWDEWERVTYATWEFQGVYTNQPITNTCAIYLKPTLPSMPTETWTPGSGNGNQTWAYPRSWEVVVKSKFKEMDNMPTNVYTKLDDSFIDNNAGVLTVVFGSNEFSPLHGPDSEPEYPDAPTEATASEGEIYDDNTGSVGTMKGSYVNPNDYFFLKTWQFNYCTNKFW